MPPCGGSRPTGCGARRWAEWIAAASGAIYLPFEVYELSLGASLLKACTFAGTLAIVAYMAYTLRQRRDPGS